MEQALIEKIKSRIEELKEDFDFIGVRMSDNPEENIECRSYVWEDGEQTEEQLRGLCTVAHDRGWEDLIGAYHYDYIYIVAGDNWSENGNDFGELVIEPEIVERVN